MPPGRPVNHDKRITAALTALRKALVAKEQDQIEQRVAAQMAGLVGGLGGPDTKAAPKSAKAATPKKARKGKPGRPSAGRLRQMAAMKAYWAKKKAGKMMAAGRAAKKIKGSTGTNSTGVRRGEK